MQANAFTDEFGRQHVAFEELTDQDDADDDENMRPVRIELRQRHAKRNHEGGQRTDIGYKRQKPGNGADQDAEIQSRESEPDRIIDAEDDAYG